MVTRKQKEIRAAGFLLSKTLICLRSEYNKKYIQREVFYRGMRVEPLHNPNERSELDLVALKHKGIVIVFEHQFYII